MKGKVRYLKQRLNRFLRKAGRVKSLDSFNDVSAEARRFLESQDIPKELRKQIIRMYVVAFLQLRMERFLGSNIPDDCFEKLFQKKQRDKIEKILKRRLVTSLPSP